MTHIECTCGDGACILCDDNGRQKHITISDDPTRNWSNDDIQFPRLLSEIYSTISFSDEEWDDLCLSMDLDREQIHEVFERADATWQDLKSRTRGRRHDAEDQQPWRCTSCGEAVSHIRKNDCACTRALRDVPVKE